MNLNFFLTLKQKNNFNISFNFYFIFNVQNIICFKVIYYLFKNIIIMIL